MNEDRGISVVVPTFNRADGLRMLLASLERVAPPRCPWDIIVVDNGSTDGTADVVKEFEARSPVPLAWISEPRKGVSFVRNAGIRRSSRPVVAFTDDDQEVDAEWLVVIERIFAEHPLVDAIGGRVFPVWPGHTPDWLTPQTLGPASIIDRGPERIRVTSECWMCLPGGNMAWRRDALLALGGFSTAFPRTQDRELLVRHLLAGGEAMYVPEMIVHHHLDGGRLTRAFFRAWNRTEGRFRAEYAFEELLTARGGLQRPPEHRPRLFGVARYLYREWAEVMAAYVRARMSHRRSDAAAREARLLMLSAYLDRRIELTATPHAPLTHRMGGAAVRFAAHAIAGIVRMG